MSLFSFCGWRIAATLPDGAVVRREIGTSTLVESVEMLANMGAKPIVITAHLRKNKEFLEGWKRSDGAAVGDLEPDADGVDMFL